MARSRPHCWKSIVFAFGFAVVMTCAWLLFVPIILDPISSVAELLYSIVNFGGGYLTTVLQMYVPGPILVGGSTWDGGRSTTFFGSGLIWCAGTAFVGAFVQGLLYAAIGSVALHLWRQRRAA